MQKKIGLITIGQSPREDIIADMKKILCSGVRIIERGALDSLTREEILLLKPAQNDCPLITRLKDKSTVVVSKQKIFPLIQKQITALEKQNVDLITLLCTENFRGLKTRKPLILPAKILPGVISNAYCSGTSNSTLTLAVCAMLVTMV
ncbi:MAG: AroM family protein [Candidatus Sumerlaeia bacterium]|nr:AroM family protein [Candidatus Sumerlaeia bacterium]